MPNDPEYEDPPCAAFMRSLSKKLATLDWNPSELDNWRDCGWFISCRKAESELEVSATRIGENDWMLQISPRPACCLLFGSKPVADESDVFELSLAVQQAVSELDYVTAPLLWVWDDFPTPDNATSEPTPPLDD